MESHKVFFSWFISTLAGWIGANAQPLKKTFTATTDTPASDGNKKMKARAGNKTTPWKINGLANT